MTEKRLIDQYLAGQLEGEALAEFEKLLQEDKALAARVEERIRETARKRLSHESAEDKTSMIRTAYAERRQRRHRKGQTRMIVLIGILVLLILVWLFLPDPTADTDAETPGQTEIETTLDDEAISGAISEIPAEDRAPNPLLEGYVGQELRPDSAYHFTVTYPPKEGRLVVQADGTHLFRLAGTLQTTVEELQAPFQVHLFSNKPEEYERFDPIFSELLNFQIEGNRYAFQLSRPHDLSPGLYYYLINNATSREIYYVGKVIVAE